MTSIESCSNHKLLKKLLVFTEYSIHRTIKICHLRFNRNVISSTILFSVFKVKKNTGYWRVSVCSDRCAVLKRTSCLCCGDLKFYMKRLLRANVNVSGAVCVIAYSHSAYVTFFVSFKVRRGERELNERECLCITCTLIPLIVLMLISFSLSLSLCPSNCNVLREKKRSSQYYYLPRFCFARVIFIFTTWMSDVIIHNLKRLPLFALFMRVVCLFLSLSLSLSLKLRCHQTRAANWLALTVFRTRSFDMMNGLVTD